MVTTVRVDFVTFFSFLGTSIENKRLKVSWARPAGATVTAVSSPDKTQTEGTNLYFSGLSHEFKQESLLQMISHYGTVTESKVLIDPQTGVGKGIAFARMSNINEARAVIQALNNSTVENGGKPLQVKFADSAQERARRKQKSYGPLPTQSNYISRYNPLGVFAQQPGTSPLLAMQQASHFVDPSALASGYSYAFQQPSAYPQFNPVCNS